MPVVREHELKDEIDLIMNRRISHADDLNVQSKFSNLSDGYISLNERNYVLLVDVSKDAKKRQDEMEVDGGNVDDDSIEREWFQLVIITSLLIKDEKDGADILKEALGNCFD